jgi:hypothetical protein
LPLLLNLRFHNRHMRYELTKKQPNEVKRKTKRPVCARAASQEQASPKLHRLETGRPAALQKACQGVPPHRR